LIWIIFSEALTRASGTKSGYWVHLGTIVLRGEWQVHAAAALLMLSAVGSVLIGSSLFPKGSRAE